MISIFGEPRKLGEPRAVGWLARLIWRKYNPVQIFRVSSSISVVECDNEQWPILFDTGGAEHHVFRISEVTAKEMVKAINRIIATDRSLDNDHNDNEKEFFPGDEIKIWLNKGWFQEGQWRLKRMGLGMPRLTPTKEEWTALGEIIQKILAAR